MPANDRWDLIRRLKVNESRDVRVSKKPENVKSCLWGNIRTFTTKVSVLY